MTSPHAVRPKERRSNPDKHRVYNDMHNLHVQLQDRADCKSFGPSTEARLEHKKAAGQYVHQHRQRVRTKILDAVCTAKDTLWKYMNKHTGFARQARIIDGLLDCHLQFGMSLPFPLSLLFDP